MLVGVERNHELIVISIDNYLNLVPYRFKVVIHIRDNFGPESSLRGLWTLYTTSNPDDPVSESYYKSEFVKLYQEKIFI